MSENLNISQEQTPANEMAGLMQEVLARAKALGATAASVMVNKDRGYSVDVRMRQVETVIFNEDKNISLIVYVGHRKGGASSTDTSSAAIESLAAAAVDIAKVSAEDKCFGLPDRELMTDTYPDLDLFHPWTLSPPEAIRIALACEDRALSLDKRIKNSDGVNLATYEFIHGFANSYGGTGIIKGTKHSLSCSFIAEQNNSMQRDYDYTTARHAAEMTAFDLVAKSAVEKAISKLGARKINTQKVPVLFSSQVSASLLSSFINAISGSNLYRKNSFLLNTQGQQLFPAMINIYEQPHLQRGLGSAAFDAEGVPTRANSLVAEGHLQQYVLSSYSARRLGLKTTANSGGVHNLTVDATAGGLNELIKTMDRGLLVTELMGQGVNGLTGDYSRGASGFWVEHGEIQFPVEEITIAGNLKEMFKNIIAVGTDYNPNIATRCGSILIAQMMIAGN